MAAKQPLRKLIPFALRQRVLSPLVYEIGAFMVDAGARLMGQRDASIPPTRLHRVGTGGYKAGGWEFLHHFVQIGKLEPTHDVLEVGCGIGGKAFTLTSYLKRGSYRGIDVVPEHVKWCQENITPKFPHFRFEIADLYNKAYNPAGKATAADYRFPWPDRSFDFVFLTSVFTHMLPADTANYLREIGRVLRPTGRLFSTWFVLNPESRELVAKNPGARQVVHPYPGDPGVQLENTEVPEATVAYDEGLIRSLHTRGGLRVEDPIRFGSWCGRGDYLSYQDIVTAVPAGRPD